MAHTCVTITTPPGRAARNSALSRAACSRMPAARSARRRVLDDVEPPAQPARRTHRGGRTSYRVVVGYGRSPASSCGAVGGR